MKKLYAPTGGMNDKDHIKDDNIMDEIINYEQIDQGKIQKRKDPMTWDATFNTALTGSGKPFNGGTVTFIPEEPFYPTRIPTVMSEDWDYMIPVFGINSDSEYVLYLYYYDNDTEQWAYTQIDLESQGIVYNESSSLLIKYLRDMALILDYDGGNEPHYIRVDEDNDIVYDLLRNSVARPDRALSFDKPTDDGVSRENFFTSDIDSKLGAPNLYRWFYTIVNKYADEGNPSPASLPIDLTFSRITTDQEEAQYVKQITLNGFSPPVDASAQMKEEIKYYRLYRQQWDADNANGFTQPQFVTDILIVNPDEATSYTDTIEIETYSPEISFENNVAPIARDGELAGNSLFLSKIITRINVLGNFDVIHKIPVTNLNSETYPNGITRMRLDYDIVDNNSTLKPNLSFLMQNKNLVRMFDSDLGTPIPVLYKDYFGSGEEDIGDPQFDEDG